MTPAERLAARLDELASSLHRAGAGDAATARLLELAAVATLKALELELRVEERNAPHVLPRPMAQPAELSRAA